MKSNSITQQSINDNHDKIANSSDTQEVFEKQEKHEKTNVITESCAFIDKQKYPNYVLGYN